MSVGDWDITQGGDASIAHSAFQNVNVPDQQLTHDVWARQLDNQGGAGFGRQLFLYGSGAPDYAEFDLSSDVSIRGAFCMGLRNGSHSLGMGVHLDGFIPPETSSKQNLSKNGYQLILTEDGVNWNAKLWRYTSSSGFAMGDADLASGAPDDYKWFHLRLDLLLQPNGDATLQVFQNDIIVNPINPGSPPEWGASWVKLFEAYDIAFNVPAFSRIGWGGQVDPGAGMIYETYSDWLEVWYS